MATLEKIRSKGTFLLIVVGLAILAFVIGDFLGSGSTYFQESRNNVAKINGQKIKAMDFMNSIEQMRKDFFRGCKSHRMTLEQTKELWASMLIYGFNKGHSTGYSIISVDQMWYKMHYPAVFWYVKIKYAGNDSDFYKYCMFAAKDGAVVMLPHVNCSAKTSIRKIDGEYVIQQGLNSAKGIGDKAAQAIGEEREKNGVFRDFDDFYDRCKGGAVNERVIKTLRENGALEFHRKKYLKRVVAYNSTLLGKAERMAK